MRGRAERFLMNTALERGVTLALALVAAACTTAPPSEPKGASHSDIIGGKASARESVVLLVHFDGETPGSTCTGTLLLPNLVLTARHCVAELGSKSTAGSVVRNYDAGDLFVFTGADAPKSIGSKANAAAGGATL